jgi:hypothetical protein
LPSYVKHTTRPSTGVFGVRVTREQEGQRGSGAGDGDRRTSAASQLVLTIGLTDEDHHWLSRIEAPQRFRYRPLGDPVGGADPELCRPRAFIEAGLAELRALDEPVAGIIAADDYPSTPLAAAIAQGAGLPGPGFEATLVCAHKAWSRIVQREVVPQAVPRFQLIDPQRTYGAADLELDFPFWLKPVKSALSFLSHRVASLAELAEVQARARAELPRYARAFTEMLEMSRVAPPAALAGTNGEWLIAEELMGGRQCTLEACCAAGRVQRLGVVDSVRLPNRVSFSRFEYPSRLPAATQDGMLRIAERVMQRVGFGQGIFNIEFFVGADGRPMIIEINPRICPQFTDLYAKVDGTLTHQVLVELATVRTPALRRGAGRYACAASYVLRTAEDCVVRRVPSAAEIALVEQRFPDTVVQALALPGERLSEHAQDSYTFRYALIQLGAHSRADLRRRFEQASRMLRFELEPVSRSENKGG